MNKERFSTILPDELIERVREFSSKTGISQAHMTQKALEDYLYKMQELLD